MVMTLMALPSAMGSPLAVYAWNARVLVISAPSKTDIELARQDALLQTLMQSMKERDLVVVRAIGSEASDDRGTALDATAVRRAAALRSDHFGVALIGKDGGIKLSRTHVVAGRELFETIDAMPMRRDEIRRSRP